MEDIEILTIYNNLTPYSKEIIYKGYVDFYTFSYNKIPKINNVSLSIYLGALVEEMCNLKNYVFPQVLTTYPRTNLIELEERVLFIRVNSIQYMCIPLLLKEANNVLQKLSREISV